MKRTVLAALACLFTIKAFPQNNPPVAVNDTVEVVAQVPVIIDALANDYDPDGNGFNIDWYSETTHYSLDTINRQFIFKSGNSNDETSFRYKIKDNGNPPEISASARVSVNILVNPDVPFAVSDTFEVLELVPVELDLLVNDLDPNGDALKLSGLSNGYECEVRFSDDSMHVIVIPDQYYYGHASFSYFVKESNTPEAYLSDWVDVHLDVLHNPDIPVSMPDTAFTTGGIPVSISVLENDYDPQGESIEIHHHSSGGFGTVIRSGENFIFTPFISFAGIGGFAYNIRESGDTNIYSPFTPVKVVVAKNPDCPVGVPDHAEGMTSTPITIDILANDYDINGDPFEIMDIETISTAEISGNQIIYTSNPLAYPLDSLFYRVMQSNNNDYYSEWTTVYIDLSLNPDLPVAVSDFVSAPFAFPITISPLENDIPNAADSLKLLYASNSSTGKVNEISESQLIYQSFTNATTLDSITYVIGDYPSSELRSKGKIYITLPEHHYYDSLTFNQINAGVNADGMLFANIVQIPGEGLMGDIKPHFKYPASGQISPIFNSIPWIGGMKDVDSLYFAGERYRQSGADFQPGPVSDDYDSIFTVNYYKLWKLTISEIEFHRNNWWKGGYVPIEDIALWPGNGAENSGQAEQLAPYFDFNQDQKYDPMDGDYPLIRGDQCIFFMMNDDIEHTESDGERAKVEIHGMAYVYDSPGDSALAHTVFVHYDMINRSGNTYNETYTGIFTDFDLGNPWDDYVGADVMRNSYYCYNGNYVDEDCADPMNPCLGYGLNPPAQSVTLLSGPLLDPDGIDNLTGECDFSINGYNFGNGSQDDERLGMTGFIYGSFSGYPEPNDYRDYYNFMKGIWNDGTHLNFGGTGYYESVGPECNYIFPGDSDPLNFGTGCVTPNPPYNQEGYYWTDSLVNDPGDRRGLGSMGPFTFKPGDVQEIELAYVVANGWNGPVSSVNKLMEYIDTLRYRVSQGEIIIPNDQLGVQEDPGKINRIRIYPNPAGDQINIKLEGTEYQDSKYVITELSGRIVQQGKLLPTSSMVNIRMLKPGFYLITIISKDSIYSGKFIKH